MRHLRRLHGVSLRRYISGPLSLGQRQCLPQGVLYFCKTHGCQCERVRGGCKSPDKSVAAPVTPKAPLWPVKVTSSQPLSSA